MRSGWIARFELHHEIAHIFFSVRLLSDCTAVARARLCFSSYSVHASPLFQAPTAVLRRPCLSRPCGNQPPVAQQHQYALPHSPALAPNRTGVSSSSLCCSFVSSRVRSRASKIQISKDLPKIPKIKRAGQTPFFSSLFFLACSYMISSKCPLDHYDC